MIGTRDQSCQPAAACKLCFFLYAGMQSMGPAVQYMAGELSVEQGMVLPLLASHNTVRMHFDIEEAEYLHLTKPDASFPPLHFAMLADRVRNQVDSLPLPKLPAQLCPPLIPELLPDLYNSNQRMS